MNSICWGSGWQAVQISPWWLDYNTPQADHRDYLWQPVPVTGQAHARDLLCDPYPDVPALREALAGSFANLTRATDAQIVDHIAGKLADGELVLLRQVLTPQAALIPVQIGPIAKKTVDSPTGDATVKAVISAAYAMAQRPAPAVVEVKPASDFESVDQDLQAAALQQAAVDGVPFCEVCDKARRERAAAAQKSAA